MEIPLCLMCLALWQEAFQVRGWTLLFRLIYGLLSAVSYHLFRKKFNGLISQPRAKQASVRILKIYVNVQHNFHLRKQGDLPEQAALCFCKLFQLWICYLQGVFFSLGALVAEALGFDTVGVSACFKASLLWWKESFHKYSNCCRWPRYGGLDVKSVPEKDSFPLAIKSALKQNVVSPVNTEVS